MDFHSDHCRACKERVRGLLTAIYGDCRVNHPFDWPSRFDHYENTRIGSALREVRLALQNFRGNGDFIKSPTVPPCDYLVGDPPFILEFDESQHFSGARLTSLVHYPEDLPVGFSVSRWQELCRSIDAKDDQPFDRDERRAWYDTLRDLVPIVHGFKPTVRIYAAEQQWCRLEPQKSGDVEVFYKLLLQRQNSAVSNV